jgi:hypothetical protein
LFDYAAMKLSCDEEPEVQKYFTRFPEKKAWFENPKLISSYQIANIIPINDANEVQGFPKANEVPAPQELKERPKANEVPAPQELKEPPTANEVSAPQELKEPPTANEVPAAQEFKERQEANEVPEPQKANEVLKPQEIQIQQFPSEDVLVLQKISSLKRTRKSIEEEIHDCESTIENLKKKKTEIVKEIEVVLKTYVEN